MFHHWLLALGLLLCSVRISFIVQTGNDWLYIPNRSWTCASPASAYVSGIMYCATRSRHNNISLNEVFNSLKVNNKQHRLPFLILSHNWEKHKQESVLFLRNIKYKPCVSWRFISWWFNRSSGMFSRYGPSGLFALESLFLSTLMLDSC